MVLRLAFGAEAHLLGIGVLDVLGRAQVDVAGRPVDDNGVAVIGEPEYVLCRSDERQAERLGDDDDVAVARALLQHDAAQARPIVVEELGRPHRARDEDGVLRHVAGRLGAVQRSQHAVGEVVEVA